MDIQFASTINSAYVPGAIKFLKSLKYFNPNYNYIYNFLVINNSLTSLDKQNIKNVYNNSNFIDIHNEDYRYDSLSKKWRDWGYNCFNRFDIFLIKCDKLIFFDLDMLVFSSLDELLSIECDFGSVQAPEECALDHPRKKYFDGGLMVISKKFLNSQTKNSLIEISKQKKWTSDEPVLNVFFKKVTWLPKKFNILTSEFNNFKKEDISILQYVGNKKPWHSKKIIENFDDFILKTQGIISIVKLQNLFDSVV